MHCILHAPDQSSIGLQPLLQQRYITLASRTTPAFITSDRNFSPPLASRIGVGRPASTINRCRRCAHAWGNIYIYIYIYIYTHIYMYIERERDRIYDTVGFRPCCEFSFMHFQRTNDGTWWGKNGKRRGLNTNARATQFPALSRKLCFVLFSVIGAPCIFHHFPAASIRCAAGSYMFLQIDFPARFSSLPSSPC